jgi:hypothetical protein
MAGNNLRNAWANVIRFSTCPETHRRDAPTPEHAAECPACWFISAENQPGSIVRPYAFTPPNPPQERIPAGETFSFGLTLFGEATLRLAYVLQAAYHIGRTGVGSGRRDGLGRFRLEEIQSGNPFSGRSNTILERSSNMVKLVPIMIGYLDAANAAAALPERLEAARNHLSVRFISPTRLDQNNRLVKSPDFDVLFQRLLYRIDDLSRQYAGGERRDRASLNNLLRAAERVRLVETGTQWFELSSWSGRKGARTPLSGLIGDVTYYAKDWEPLLPWLLLGQGTQVGKSAVKGNGVYQLTDQSPGYWTWLNPPLERIETAGHCRSS